MGRSGRQKAYGRVVGESSHDNRPGWKGPSYQKPKEKAKAKPSPKSQATDEESEKTEKTSIIPLELQQLLLNIFKDVFSDVLAEEGLKETLQEVKGALFGRDFERAFGKREYLEAYAVRWSPPRALCYQSILVDIHEHLIDLIPGFNDGLPDGSVSDALPASSFKAVSFGGGAAEVIAFGGLVRYLRDITPSSDTQQSSSSQSPNLDAKITNISQTLQEISLSTTAPTLNVTLLDIANWDEVVHKLHQGLFALPDLSKYASAATREANEPLIPPNSISTAFRSLDLLSLSQEQILAEYGQAPILLTLLFTLNELYTVSISKTTAFLLKLTMAVKTGTMLLVVDSPGSYSETKVASSSEAKKYPMKWLMDHTLLGKQARKKNDDEVEKGKEAEQEDETTKDKDAAWEKVVEDDSKWFRIPEGLKYPIPLENMRYQIHLYRRI